jgi:hypothetical protein
MVVDADFGIAIFWTRLGSPTGEAESGTVEEIDELVTTNRRVLVYFCDRGTSLKTLDLQQLQKRNEYKEQIRKHGLVEDYTAPAQLHGLVMRGLDDQVNRLSHDKPATDLNPKPSRCFAIVPDHHEPPFWSRVQYKADDGPKTHIYAGLHCTNLTDRPIALLQAEILKPDGNGPFVVTHIQDEQMMHGAAFNRITLEPHVPTTLRIIASIPDEPPCPAGKAFVTSVALVDNYARAHVFDVTFAFKMQRYSVPLDPESAP